MPLIKNCIYTSIQTYTINNNLYNMTTHPTPLSSATDSQFGDDGRMDLDDTLVLPDDEEGHGTDTGMDTTTNAFEINDMDESTDQLAQLSPTTTTVETPPLPRTTSPTTDSTSIGELLRNLPPSATVAEIIVLLAGGKLTGLGQGKDGSSNPQVVGTGARGPPTVALPRTSAGTTTTTNAAQRIATATGTGIALSRGSTSDESTPSVRRASDTMSETPARHARLRSTQRTVRFNDKSTRRRTTIPIRTSEVEEDEETDRDWKHRTVSSDEDGIIEITGGTGLTTPVSTTTTTRKEKLEKATGAKLPQLPIFSGTAKDKMTAIQWIDAYLLTGQLEGWSDALTLRTMCKGLQGEAMEWLSQNRDRVMRDLKTFEKAMKKRFIQGTKAGKITEMLNIKQKPDESPIALGQRVRAWARKANLDMATAKSLLYAAFLDALHPMGKQAVIQQGAATFEQAVQIATRQYEAHLVNRRGKKTTSNQSGKKRK